MSEAPVAKILDEIKSQSGANFVVNSAIIANLGKMSLDVANVTLAEAIGSLLMGSGYDYKISGNNVTFVLKAVSPIEIYQVSGKVTDQNGKPIPGVTVMIKGTPFGTATNASGEYSVAMAKGQSLLFSYIGMASCEVTFNPSNTVINVVMREESQKVGEVVVTGMFRKSAQTFTGAAVTITSEELKQYGSRNLITTLNNIDPSFNIIENNIDGSNPNKLPEVTIRGSSSIPNVNELQSGVGVGLNTPLIILDGFESSLQTLFDMNEDEVESITILKDAAATSLYGSRGANGIIIVTTKAPAQGKLKISYRGTADLELPDLTSYNILNAREKLELERLVGKFEGTANNSFQDFNKYYNYLMGQINDGVDTYWMAKPLQVGVGQTHNLRAEGGDEMFRYSGSVEYKLTKGIMKGSERRNVNATVQLSYTMDKIRISNSTTIGQNNNAMSPYGSFSSYVRMNPYLVPFDSAGNIVKALGSDGENASLRWGNGVGNPLWDATLNTYYKTETTSIVNNFSLEWNPVPGLALRGMLGYSKSVGENNQFYPPEHTKFKSYKQDDILRRGEYTHLSSKSDKVDASFNVNYSHVFWNKHHIYAGLNANLRENASSAVGFSVEGFANEEFDFPGAALQYSPDAKPTGEESRSRAVGITGNANYSYDNIYFVDFTYSVDGNSSFGKNNPYGSFWSLGVGWNIHNLSFLRESGVLNQLKLRGSLGSNGSQAFNAYQALTTYKYFVKERYFAWLGADVMRLGNPDLKWQQKMNYNVGMESELFNRRLQLFVDLYLETTRNQISSLTIPSSTGFKSYIANLGMVENRGIEVKLSAIFLDNPDKRLRWILSVSGIHNRNTIKKLSPMFLAAQASIEAQNTGANPLKLYKEGYSTDAIWVVPSLGIDPSTGRELYRGFDGSPTWVWDQGHIVRCGISHPKIKGNINTSLRWKNLQLTASFGYRWGGQLYNETLISNVENADYDNNVDKRIFVSRWKNPGDKVMFKSIYITEATKKTSRFIQDEYTLNCQSINLSFDLPHTLVKKLNMSNISFIASTSDLFYISSVKRERGTDYPFSHRVSLGINVIF